MEKRKEATETMNWSSGKGRRLKHGEKETSNATHSE